MEKPVLGLAIIPAAAAVGVSRVYVGVHYPSDVIAGATLGSLMALASTKVWPRVPEQPPKMKLLPRAEFEAMPEGSGMVAFVNAASGGSDDPADDLREAFPEAKVIENRSRCRR